MSRSTGDWRREISNTLHQIYINNTLIKGLRSFEALLERIRASWEKVRRGRDDYEADNFRDNNLKWLGKYNFKQKSGSWIGRYTERNLVGHKNAEKRKLADGINVDKRACHIPGEDLLVSNAVNETRLTDKMPSGESMTIYEELIRDLDIIASANDGNVEELFAAELESFEKEFDQHVVDATKNLREQLMISVGYRFLIMSAKLKIENTDKEIEKESELARKLSKCLRNDRYSLNDFGEILSQKVEDDIENESDERREIARLKESILLADCLIGLQRRDIRLSEKLIQEMSSEIQRRKDVLSMLEYENGCHVPRKSNHTVWERNEIAVDISRKRFHSASFDGLLTEMSELTNQDSVFYSRDGPCVEATIQSKDGTQSYYELPEEIFIEHDESSLQTKEHKLFNQDRHVTQKSFGSNNAIIKESNDLFGDGNEASFASEFSDYNQFLIETLSQSHEDSLCDTLIARLSVGSNIIKIPNEIADVKEDVFYHVNNAPRALGRSKRGKGRNFFRQTVYRTKAIEV